MKTICSHSPSADGQAHTVSEHHLSDRTDRILSFGSPLSDQTDHALSFGSPLSDQTDRALSFGSPLSAHIN